jgi:ketosteroid isomerase-like protein
LAFVGEQVLEEIEIMLNKKQAVLDMEAAAFTGDWEKYKSFLADDIYVRIGNNSEARGPQAVADFMVKMLTTSLAINDLKIRGAWETEDTVIVEFDIKAVRMRDNKNVGFPCLDVYRFKNGKIREWNVYAIETTHVH